MSIDYEPYVADPAEPPRRRRLARLTPVLWSALVVILAAALTSAYWLGRGEEDPALTTPPSEQQD